MLCLCIFSPKTSSSFLLSPSSSPSPSPSHPSCLNINRLRARDLLPPHIANAVHCGVENGGEQLVRRYLSAWFLIRLNIFYIIHMLPIHSLTTIPCWRFLPRLPNLRRSEFCGKETLPYHHHLCPCLFIKLQSKVSYVSEIQNVSILKNASI